MNKIIKVLTIVFLFTALAVGRVEAADPSVELESPKSPTNQRDFTITFVALDIQDRPVTVRCYKKAPGEGGFSIFGSDFNLPAGGESDNCEVTSSLVSAEGTYEFYVIATADAESAQSNTVSVEYKAGGPGTPTYYGKEQPASCQYRIKFKTANDGGETVKVEVYRSDSTSFNADSGTRIATIGIGSNQEGSHLDTVPECNKTYYYAIRAFNDAGNGSDAVGDTQTITIIEETAPVTSAIGPIPVESNAVATAPAEPSPTAPREGETSVGEVLGEIMEGAPAPSPETETGLSASLMRNAPVLLGSALLIASFALYFAIRRRA